MSTKFKIGLVCGGPSRERGISLNSARSVLDHLGNEQTEICPFYVGPYGDFYQISPSQLYSNTPSDFDFKLAQTAKKLDQDTFKAELSQLDMVFPAIHGTFGEDGQLQTLLEDCGVPFAGADSACCQKMFFKHKAAKILRDAGFETIPSQLLTKDAADNADLIANFFETHNLSKAIVKPVAGGSSIGVFFADSADLATKCMGKIFDMGIDDQAIIEPFCEGREFTVIVLQNQSGEPVALVPTEISISYEGGQIFDYRRKYLPTNNTQWHSPPNFDDSIVADIRDQAEQIFSLFDMKDFARLDGWLLDDGRLVFTDLNPISGMEQNSFIFQQTSRIGLTHSEALHYIADGVCRRAHIDRPTIPAKIQNSKKTVHVLFGGGTAERQVSVMSGTNIWLKLRQSDDYDPAPYFLDPNGDVWAIPYTYALNHTVEEIQDNCLTAPTQAPRLAALSSDIRDRLGLGSPYDPVKNLPQKMSFDDFIKMTKQNDAFLFLGLHGGDGEGGKIQAILEKEDIPFNGSGSMAANLCMDKYKTGEMINAAGNAQIISAPKTVIEMAKFKHCSDSDIAAFWNELTTTHNIDSFIIKPRMDGCSAGIVRLFSGDDLQNYVRLVREESAYIPAGTFPGQPHIIEMAVDHDTDYLLEAFIETDRIHVDGHNLCHEEQSGWLEFTVGVLERGGVYHAMNPSITVAEGTVLSLEEKFQGGTGINITPPPESLVSSQTLNILKNGIETIAARLGIGNYARIDVFFNIKTAQIIVIEANTLPGMTPSTVIYHQALAETPPLTPTMFIETLISSRLNNACQDEKQQQAKQTEDSRQKQRA